MYLIRSLLLCLWLALPAAWAQPLLHLHAAFTHPSSSGLVLDAPQAYFISADGQHRLRLDAWPVWPKMAAGPGLPIDNLAQLPSQLRLRWFSAHDDQFWSVHLPLPAATLKHYVAQSLKETDDLTVFDRLIVTVKADGWVSVWLGNATHEIQLTDEVQARAVQLDWADFTRHWPQMQQGRTRAEWVASIQAQTERPYYNLRFKRVYEDDAPAVGSAYEVYADTDQGRQHYCGRTDRQGETREFISLFAPQAYNMTHDEAGCALIQQLGRPSKP
ncbi:MAG: DUF2931 family protein [Neisseriaceae bacterium]|nr:DUF2931 family protein [Neisseriaceae bacterium]MBP6860972.1 DUF2931 family protein [Neisseriaceae bacterium]